MTRIGFMSYARSPRMAFPALRERALLAEAALQGEQLVFLDGSSCDLGNGRIIGELWTPDGWTSSWVALPDVVIIPQEPFTDVQRVADAWVRRSCPVIADSGADKL